MPLERVSKGFKDLSMSLQINPLNNDIIAIKNETAISRSIRNLIFTLRGERFFNPSLGSGVSGLLFENMDEITASILTNEITSTIEIYEPRVELISVDVSPNYDTDEYYVTITYNIIGIDVLPQQLSFALSPTR